ncbi:LCP family protein [Williamsia sp. SKLECPSW1]
MPQTPPPPRRPTAGELLRARQADDGSVPDLAAGYRSIPEATKSRRSPTPHKRRARSTRHRSPLAIPRGVAAVLSCAVLVACGVGWAGARQVVGGFHTSNALADAPRSHDGAENILLMGLDTRNDRDGNPLPPDILAQLHAGDGSEGGYNTNTLILIHIPSDGKKIVAFSIPRDDYVTMVNPDGSTGIDGTEKAKIKEAYGRRKAEAENELAAQGMTDPVELETRGRDAGRAETLATVRALTGVPIDKFAEVSLVGFYDIAKALGGVTVCLNHAVSDSYSGAHFSAGVHKLNAAQALAFVRQRHGLDNGDLDRTHRQQAFLLSVEHELQSSGVFSDLGKLSALVDVAQRDVVLSSGWNLVDDAHELGDIAGQSVTFTTLPVVRYDTVDGQDVNIVDPAAIKQQVQTAFGMIPPVATTPSSSATDEAAQTVSTSQDQASSDTGDGDTDSTPDQGKPVTTTASGVPCVN